MATTQGALIASDIQDDTAIFTYNDYTIYARRNGKKTVLSAQEVDWNDEVEDWYVVADLNHAQTVAFLKENGIKKLIA